MVKRTEPKKSTIFEKRIKVLEARGRGPNQKVKARYPSTDRKRVLAKPLLRNERPKLSSR